MISFGKLKDFVSGVGSFFGNLLGVPTVDELVSSGIDRYSGDLSGKSLFDNFPNVDFTDTPHSGYDLHNFLNQFLFKSTGQPYYDSMLDFYQQGIDKGFFSSAEDVKAESALNRAFQAEQADIERKWYENMSNTSYQRAVEDLQKAGLNPILGFSNFGSGGASSAHAAVPSGGTGLRLSASSFSDLVSAGSNLMSSAGKLMNGIASMIG